MILSRFLFGVFAALLLTANASAQGLSVKVKLDGLGKNLTEELRPVSSLARAPEKFSALAPIRRAANTDAQALLAALKSKGYYAAVVTPSLDRKNGEVTVTFTIERGEKFKISGYELRYVDEETAPRPESLYDLGVDPDGSPTGEALQEVEKNILERFWSQGFIGAEIAGREVRARFEDATATAVFRVQTGPKAIYGDVVVKGTDRTDPAYLRQFRTFESGEVAQREDLDEYRERLAETSLFNEIEIEPLFPEGDGRTDIGVTVRERKPRTIGGGINYATDIGPGANIFWENRNAFSRGETIRAEISASEPVQEGIASFRKQRPRLPGFYTLSAQIKNEDTDAFNAQTGRIGGSLGKYWLDRNLTTEGGLRFQYSDAEFTDGLDEETGNPIVRNEIFRAVSVPMRVLWNNQDAPLDPQRGFIAGVTVTPFIGTEDFQRIETTYVDRVFWGEKDGGTLAGRFKLGAIYGAGRSNIPPTERFYAGGGGSLRGYAFQEASPIDNQTGDILGGASLAEFSFELRQHVTESIEVAVFTDIGGAFEGNTPNFDQVLVGAGFGVRYHTPIGPLRVDFAIPVERRSLFIDNPDFDPSDPDSERLERIFRDDAFQFLIALGQPF